MTVRPHRAAPDAIRATQLPASPKIEIIEETGMAVSPIYHVVLHNDDHNTPEHVVHSLIEVLSIAHEWAEELMLQAHHHGEAIVATCPKDLAERFRSGLESRGLNATIEPANS